MPTTVDLTQDKRTALASDLRIVSAQYHELYSYVWHAREFHLLHSDEREDLRRQVALLREHKSILQRRIARLS